MKVAHQHCDTLSYRALIRRVVLIVAVLLSLGSLARAIGESIGTGSGFLIEPGGYILTNYHVVAGAQRVGVVLHNAVKHEAAIVALDEYKDLALLKIDGSDFPIAAIGILSEIRGNGPRNGTRLSVHRECWDRGIHVGRQDKFHTAGSRDSIVSNRCKFQPRKQRRTTRQ